MCSTCFLTQNQLLNLRSLFGMQIASRAPVHSMRLNRVSPYYCWLGCCLLRLLAKRVPGCQPYRSGLCAASLTSLIWRACFVLKPSVSTTLLPVQLLHATITHIHDVAKSVHASQGVSQGVMRLSGSGGTALPLSCTQFRAARSQCHVGAADCCGGRSVSSSMLLCTCLTAHFTGLYSTLADLGIQPHDITARNKTTINKTNATPAKQASRSPQHARSIERLHSGLYAIQNSA